MAAFDAETLSYPVQGVPDCIVDLRGRQIDEAGGQFCQQPLELQRIIESGRVRRVHSAALWFEHRRARPMLLPEGDNEPQ